MSFDANIAAAWFGAVISALDLSIHAYETFKNRANVKIKLSDQYGNFVVPGNYLAQKYPSNMKIAVFNVEFVNKGQQEITLDGIRAWNFVKKEWMRPDNEQMGFKNMSLKKINSNDPHFYSLNPRTAPVASLPMRVKALDMKTFQISLLASECIKNKKARLMFLMPGKNKKVILKIPLLSDYLHSEGYKLS